MTLHISNICGLALLRTVTIARGRSLIGPFVCTAGKHPEAVKMPCVFFFSFTPPLEITAAIKHEGNVQTINPTSFWSTISSLQPCDRSTSCPVSCLISHKTAAGSAASAAPPHFQYAVASYLQCLSPEQVTTHHLPSGSFYPSQKSNLRATVQIMFNAINH